MASLCPCSRGLCRLINGCRAGTALALTLTAATLLGPQQLRVNPIVVGVGLGGAVGPPG